MIQVEPILRVVGLRKTYLLGDIEVQALCGVDLAVEPGDYIAIMGPSGSGKSTLLNLLGCLDRPTAGLYFLGGRDVSTLSDDELSEERGRRLGFVFQAYNLIQQLNVLENISVPLFYQGTDMLPESLQRCRELTLLVGLSERLDHLPKQLSGGQQQRVAIARALINDPLVILADEPTGNLDSKTGEEILNMFDKLNREGKTIVLVTHEDHVAERAQRVIHMRDGVIDRVVLNRQTLPPRLDI